MRPRSSPEMILIPGDTEHTLEEVCCRVLTIPLNLFSPLSPLSPQTLTAATLWEWNQVR